MSVDKFNFNQKVSSDTNLDDLGFLSFFESYFSDLLDHFQEPIRSLAKNVALCGGKRIRPLLCFQCGSVDPKVTKDVLKAASILELVHVATLIHDDMLDSASLRRGRLTTHSFAGEHTAVLLGDALFSFALELATEFPTSFVCKAVAKATRITCSGEISQNCSKGDYNQGLNDYYKIIQDKTGELFKASCQVGAYLGGHSEKTIELLGDFGLSLGMNYQIYDDLIDSFGKRTNAGKTLGCDFASGKLTLPIILLLQTVSQEISTKLSNSFVRNMSIEEKKFLIQQIDDNSILEKCLSELDSQTSNLKLICDSIPDTNLSSSLLNLINTFSHKFENLDDLNSSNFLAN